MTSEAIVRSSSDFANCFRMYLEKLCSVVSRKNRINFAWVVAHPLNAAEDSPLLRSLTHYGFTQKKMLSAHSVTWDAGISGHFLKFSRDVKLPSNFQCCCAILAPFCEEQNETDGKGLSDVDLASDDFQKWITKCQKSHEQNHRTCRRMSPLSLPSSRGYHPHWPHVSVTAPNHTYYPPTIATSWNAKHRSSRYMVVRSVFGAWKFRGFGWRMESAQHRDFWRKS